ncbi:DUF6223 family protein [Streptomyces antibioticus]|uniref:DUF6223 family protein n=1 Tax=Streptomyces antibioticus TaxID=1890 RepID=UPI00339F487C
MTGLIGSVCGGIALSRTTGKGRAAAWARRNGPVTALVTGLIAAAVGGTVAATAKGALGTGNGLGGAYVAVLLGLIAVILDADLLRVGDQHSATLSFRVAEPGVVL